MRFHFYHVETGMLHGNTYATSIADPTLAMEAAKMNAPADHTPIKGEFDHLSQRIDLVTGKAVDHQPDSPSVDHEWDSKSKRWHLNSGAAARRRSYAQAKIRIAHLESNVQPRAIREHALNHPGSQRRLQDIDDEIAGLRKFLE